MVIAPLRLSVLRLWQQTREVTIPGEVADSQTSCVVTPTGTLNNGIVADDGDHCLKLLVNQRIPYLNTSSLVSVTDCAIGGPDEKQRNRPER